MIVNALAGKPLAGLRRRPAGARLALRQGPLRGDPRGAGARPGRRDLQHRRLEREAQPRDRARRLRPARRDEGASRRAARAPDHARDRPARPRPALRHRRRQDRARARLAAGRDLRVGPAQDGALVPRQRRLGRARADRRLPRLGLGQLRPARAREGPAARQERPARLGAAALARRARRRGRMRLRQRRRPGAPTSPTPTRSPRWCGPRRRI